MNILVIDVGTSSMRGILYNEAAEKKYMHRVQYNVNYLQKDRVEQNPGDWKAALEEIVREHVLNGNQHHCKINGIALTSQRSSVIPVDSEGNPLRNAIMWQDKRNIEICRSLEEQRKLIFHKTGARINPVFSGSKMTWIHDNEPEIYEKAYKIITIADYLAWIMTGAYKTDHTYGSRSSLMNLRERKWDDELLALYRIDKEKLCELIEPGDILGVTCRRFSEATGIPEGVPMISAGGDQQCAALGQGVFADHTMEITTGAGAFALAYTSTVPEDLDTDVICGAHAVKGAYVLESSMLACSSLYDWYRKNFYYSEQYQNPYDAINREIEKSPPGSNGCIAFPYFQGRGTPDWNGAATGLFAGITLRTSRGDMARAIMEAIAMEVRNNLEILEKYTGEMKRIFIGGGLTNFVEFNQMQADIYQKKLICYEAGEETSLGALISAGVALGVYSSYEEAFATIKEGKSKDRYLPLQQNVKIYQTKQKQMNALYEKIWNQSGIKQRHL